MSKFITYFILVASLLALNVLFPTGTLGVPNFLFLLVLVYAFRKDDPGYLWVAFFCGLLLDLYSNVFFGSYMIAFLLIALLINYTTRTFFSAEPSIVYIAAVTAVSYLTMVGFLYLFSTFQVRFDQHAQVLPTVYLHRKIWMDLMFNLVFVGPIYYLTTTVDSVLEKFKNKESF